MIVPRKYVKPHLATCCFWPLVGICYTVLYNVINPLPLGFVRSLHDVHLEFCKRIATLIYQSCTLRLRVQMMLLLWKFYLPFSCMT